MNRILVSSSALMGLQMLRQRIKKHPLPSFVGIIETRHFLPGRVRFYVPVLKEDKALGTKLQKQLKTVKAIHKVEITPLTGSLLLSYAPSEVEPIILMGAIMKLLGIDHKLERSRQGKLRRQVGRWRKNINNAVFDASGGILDFNSLLSLALAGGAGYSFRKMGLRTTPGPFVLSWWALNRMTGDPDE